MHRFEKICPGHYASAMLHENLPAAIEGLSSRIIAIRDSL
jgi:hypothetical protein